MAVVTVRSATVAGGGSVTCRYCHRRTRFRGTEWLEILDDGHTVFVTTVYQGLVVLHDCRRPSMVWQCRTCGHRPPLPERPRSKRRRRDDTRCENCGDYLVQVREDHGHPSPD